MNNTPHSCGERLLLASERGDVDQVNQILGSITSRSDDLPFEDLQNALFRASIRGDGAIVRQLFQHFPLDHQLRFHEWLMRWSCSQGHLSLFEFLLQDPRFDPSMDHQFALRSCSCRGDVGMVGLLLNDPRVDPSIDDQFPLRFACERGHIGVVDLLLQDPRVDPSAHRQYALAWAYWNGHVQVIKRLLCDLRVSPADISWRALDESSTELIHILLEDPRVSFTTSASF